MTSSPPSAPGRGATCSRISRRPSSARCSRRSRAGEAAITPATAARIIRHLTTLGAAAERAGPGSVDGARARGPPAGDRRAAQQGDRSGARDLGEHREVPPPQHPREAPRRESDGGRDARCRERDSSSASDRWPGPDGPVAPYPFECPPPFGRAWCRDRTAPMLAPSPDGGGRMGYRIDIDQSGCINCGICMDTCPVEALDMSRPTSAGIETAGFGTPQTWMMEHPIQVGECIGCGICIGECPVVVMTLVAESDRDGTRAPPGTDRSPGLADRGRAAVAADGERDPRGPQARASVAVGRTCCRGRPPIGRKHGRSGDR